MRFTRKDCEKLQPMVMTPFEGDWYIRDTYNTVWRLRRSDYPDTPFYIELYERMLEPINAAEAALRSMK